MRQRSGKNWQSSYGTAHSFFLFLHKLENEKAEFAGLLFPGKGSRW